MRNLRLLTIFIFLLIFNFNFHFNNGARILFFFGLSTYSHRILVWPLVEELVRRGHEVTYLSSSPSKTRPTPNVTDFVPTALKQFYNGEGVMNSNLLHARLEGRLFSMWNKMPGFGELICDIILGSPDVKTWAESASYDLVIMDSIFNDCGYGLVHKFKAKHILFGTTVIWSWNYDANGLLPENSWIPEVIHHFGGAEKLGFLHRVVSTVETLRWHFVRKYSYLPRIEEIIRDRLGIQDMPPIEELEKDLSVFFTNTHFSEEYARALPPFVVPIGGLHITNSASQSIPQNIENFIAGTPGFIYISFGSDARISTLPAQKLKAMFSAFEKAKLPCIWKWDAEIPEKVPENVLMVNWAPQLALLAHKSIKMMITHGGILSIHEAIHHKVPLIVMPIFAEQDFNAERVHRKGFGIQLEIGNFNEDELSNAITSILSNPGYKQKVEEIASIFKDRINSPLETVVWYTEYALRHNNETSYMKPYSIHQSWYERRLLDVWCFLLVLGLLIAFFIFKILKSIGQNLRKNYLRISSPPSIKIKMKIK